MKIDIYVTNDCKGVAVPTGTDIATLPQNVFELAKSARSTKHNIDTDDGCIGSGIVAALTGLTKDG